MKLRVGMLLLIILSVVFVFWSHSYNYSKGGPYEYPLCGGGYTPVATTELSTNPDMPCISGPARAVRNYTLYDFSLVLLGTVLVAGVLVQIKQYGTKKK